MAKTGIQQRGGPACKLATHLGARRMLCRSGQSPTGTGTLIRPRAASCWVSSCSSRSQSSVLSLPSRWWLLLAMLFLTSSMEQSGSKPVVGCKPAAYIRPYKSAPATQQHGYTDIPTRQAKHMTVTEKVDTAGVCILD